MKNMKAYIIDTGYLRVDSNVVISNSTILTYNDPNAQKRWIHTPCYVVLIDHPEVGYILFDMGSKQNSNDLWSSTITDLARYYETQNNNLIDEMAKIGVKPEDVKYVIVSHLHMDHSGYIDAFKDTAEFFITLEEIRFASAAVAVSPDTKDHGWYVREIVETPVKRYHYLEEDTEILPGITALMLPGHTPGTMGIMVELESGTRIITSDAVNCQENYDGILPGIVRDTVTYNKTIKKLHKLAEDNNAEVWFGHDDAQVKAMKKLPESY